MKEIKLDYRKILEIVLIAIVCYWGLNNYKLIFSSEKLAICINFMYR